MARSVGEDHLQLGLFDSVHLDPGGSHGPHQPRLQLISVPLWHDPPLHPLWKLTVLPMCICQHRLCNFKLFSSTIISLFSGLVVCETRVWLRGAMTAASSAGDHCSRVVLYDSVADASSLNILRLLINAAETNHSIFVFKFLLQRPQIFFRFKYFLHGDIVSQDECSLTVLQLSSLQCYWWACSELT